MDALLDAIDERQFPNPALELPHAKRRENGHADESRDPKNERPRGPPAPPWPLRPWPTRRRLVHDGRHPGHCIRLISWVGIMLVLRWRMIHSDPVIVITSRIRVKMSASMDQPPSERAFMCRK